MKRILYSLALVFLINTMVTSVSHGSDATPPSPPPVFMPPPEEPTSKLPPLEKIGEGKFRLGEIIVDKAERTISFPAQVNMDRGLLEYLLVHNKGKTHESLLRTMIAPYNLQIAFILLGFEGTGQRLAMQGAPDTPKGERVTILISSRAGQKATLFPVESWLAIKTDETMTDVNGINWVFTGSYVDDSRFLAQETGSMVAIWHDPVALIDNASPGGESNRIWFVKQGAVPPVGTPVDVIIRPAK